jgi:hypothetical protein
MIDPNKLQYYTMAHRLHGFADGLKQNDADRIADGGRPRYDTEIHMLTKAANLLIDAWNEYAQANNLDIPVQVNT